MGQIVYILALLFLFSGCVPDSTIHSEIEPTKNYLEGRFLPKKLPKPKSKRQLLYEWTQKHVGLKETNGKNRSPFIDLINREAGVPMGSPYCGSYVGYGNKVNGFSYPNNYAWSPTWATKSRETSKPDSMDVFTIFYRKLNRVGHVGYHISTEGDIVHTNEGNTNDGLSREGDGFYNKRRKKATIHRFTRWD